MTQQTVKLLLFLDLPRYVRKPAEIISSIILEKLFTKEEILSIYLQVARFGPHIIGLNAATQVFFSKKPKDLTTAEAEVLISMLPSPRQFLLALGAIDSTRADYVHAELNFNFNRSYEKIIHGLKIMSRIETMPDFKLSADFSQVVLDAERHQADDDTEKNFIVETTRLVHQIPGILKIIAGSRSRLPGILDGALSLEQRILIGYYLNSPHINPALLENIESPINFEHIRELAQRHRISQLDEERSDRYSFLDQTLKNLQKNSHHGHARYLAKFHAIERIAEEFHSRKIPFYITRGIDLANRYYEKPWQKTFVDLDIFIDRSTFAQSYQLIEDLGFNIKRIGSRVRHFTREKRAQLFSHLSLLNEGIDCEHITAPIAIDLHPTKSNCFSKNIGLNEKIFLSEKCIVNVLPWKENIIELLFHGKKHGWHSLSLIYDLYRIFAFARPEEIPHLHRQSQLEGWEETFLTGLALSYYFCPLKNVPESVEKAIANFSRRSSILSSTQMLLFYPENSFRRSIYNLCYQASFEKSLLRKLQVPLKRFFRPTKNDVFYFVLPRGLFFLYYLLRPIRALRLLTGRWRPQAAT